MIRVLSEDAAAPCPGRNHIERNSQAYRSSGISTVVVSLPKIAELTWTDINLSEFSVGVCHPVAWSILRGVIRDNVVPKTTRF